VQLALAIPVGWPVHPLDDGRRVVIVPPVPASGGPDLVVEIGPLIPAPEDPREWMAATMARDVRPGTTAHILAVNETVSTVGWPMEIAQGNVVDAAEAIVETRLGAFYKLNEWAAHALVRALDVSRWEAAREAIAEMLLKARPSWQSRRVIAALIELWS
jgi:hypothetical protein